MNDKTLCVGGPFAGERVDKAPTHDYDKRVFYGVPVYYFEPEFGDFGDIAERLMYGYEQHCKAVAERNKTEVHTWGPIKDAVITDIHCSDTSVMQKELQDSYTASFLRSCRTCIIPSPFGESTPLTLSYGKCYKGYLNEAMELVVYAGTVNGELEKSMGRIGTPIAIIP